MRQKRLIFYLALLILGTATAAFILLSSRSQPWFRLASGVEVRWAAVTDGTNQSIVIGAPWEKVLYWGLPSALKARSGCAVYQFTTAGPDTTFWVEARNLNGARLSDADARFDIRYLDRYGCELVENGSSFMSFPGRSPSSIFLALRRDIYGAHGEVVGLSLREAGRRDGPPIQFLVREAALQIPSGDPPDLGVHRMDGLRFRLRRVLTGLESAPPAYNLRSWDRHFSQLEFLVSRPDGSLCRDWTPELIRLVTNEGRHMPEGIQNAFRGDALILNFDGLLNAGEKTRFEVKFTQKQNFASEQIVTLAPMAIPEREARAMDITASASNISLHLLEVGGADPNRLPESDRPRDPYVRVSASPRTPGLNVWLIEAKNERDSVPVVSSFGKDGTLYFAFKGPLQPRTLTLNFAIHTSHWLQFEAAPTRAPESHSSPP